MSSDLYTGLQWLPAAPADFTERCRRLVPGTEAGRELRALAGYALDENQLHRLAKGAARCRAGDAALAPLGAFKLGIIGNGTLDLLEPALVASAPRHGLLLECVRGHYDQILQEALSPDSEVNRARPDAVLLAIDYRALPLRAVPGDAAAEQSVVDGALAQLDAIRAAIRQHSGAVCLVQTLAPPAESLFGSFERALPGTWRSLIAAFNQRLAASIAGSQDLLLDVAGFAELLGSARWHAPAEYNMAKLPFASDCVPFYAEQVARVMGAMRGKSRRCLILDLDNTVWGGIIGDDGLEGIKIAQGDATGEAHLAVQRMALGLRERGIVLAVSSKNTDEIARQPFRKHPEMLLREDHIAVFQANWNDKATNIKAISDELALGLESMVFLDDNPVERNLVRQMLPQVAVPELPEDPALYARTLAAAGYFEAIAFSDEDRKRSSFYEDNARRVNLQKQVGDLDAYLASLQMEITFQPFDETGRARIAQLINKSNQFNLTTRRYTEAEVAEVEHDPDCFSLQVRLADMFGDNGMISVIVCRPLGEETWDIDTWLMSCRVLGRKVESMVLREILLNARSRGIRTLRGTYRPTERNAMVSDHYAKLGFTEAGAGDAGVTHWELSTATEVGEAPMAVRRSGFAEPAAVAA